MDSATSPLTAVAASMGTLRHPLAVASIRALALVAPPAADVTSDDLIGAFRWMAAHDQWAARVSEELGWVPAWPRRISAGVQYLRDAIRTFTEAAEECTIPKDAHFWTAGFEATAASLSGLDAPKISRIELTPRNLGLEVAAAATPFGSLDHCRGELGAAMAAALPATRDGATAFADLVILVEHDTRRCCDAPSDVWRTSDGITIQTPSSGTRIIVRHDRRVEVDFRGGSETRANAVIAALPPGSNATVHFFDGTSIEFSIESTAESRRWS